MRHGQGVDHLQITRDVPDMIMPTLAFASIYNWMSFFVDVALEVPDQVIHRRQLATHVPGVRIPVGYVTEHDGVVAQDSPPLTVGANGVGYMLDTMRMYAPVVGRVLEW